MKKFLFLVLLCTVLYGEELSVGAGVYAQTQPYENVDAIVVPSPVVFYDNGVVYARWTRFGVYFYGQKTKELSWGFSLTAQPRPNQYSPDDSNELRGLSEKKSSFEGGLAFTLYGDDKYLEAMVVTDMLDRYNSYIAKVEAGFKYTFAGVSLYPSAVVVYESKEFTQYYYGIDARESANSGIALYMPNGGVRVGLQSYISYPLTKSFSLFFNIRGDRLTKSAYNSPIVEEKFVYSSLASLLYRFEL